VALYKIEQLKNAMPTNKAFTKKGKPISEKKSINAIPIIVIPKYSHRPMIIIRERGLLTASQKR
jgi:hypothetical protein